MLQKVGYVLSDYFFTLICPNSPTRPNGLGRVGIEIGSMRKVLGKIWELMLR